MSCGGSEIARRDSTRTSGASRSCSPDEREREWTLAQIYDELRRLAVAGEDLSHDAAERRGGGLVWAARSSCGSWLEALEGACERYPQVAQLREAYEVAQAGAAARVSKPVEGAGAALRERRLARGWSQAELARRSTDAGRASGLDITDRQSDVSNWEHGRVGIPDRVHVALALDAEQAVQLRPAPATPGRPSSVPPLCGLTAPDIARAIHGPGATPGQMRVAGYHLSGSTAMGVDALDALLDARPDLDAREVVRELAARLRARRGA